MSILIWLVMISRISDCASPFISVIWVELLLISNMICLSVFYYDSNVFVCLAIPFPNTCIHT